MEMAAKKVGTASINRLPDEVLGRILSLLPTKLAASTTVLSKRWRNLVPLLDNLDFDESMVMYPNRKAAAGPSGFIDFVEKTLALLCECDSPIKKFSLKWESGRNESRVNRLIYNVLKRGVLELHLTSGFNQCIETEFFLSNTLESLTLSHGCYLQGSRPPGGVFFPALKTLTLSSIGFGSYEMYEWLLSSPSLEEFNIRDDDPRRSSWVGEVWGSSIKRITIVHPCCDEQEDHSLITIRTPNLVFLDYSSFVAQDYSLAFDDSLVEARLDLRLWKYYVPPFPDMHDPSSIKAVWGDATKLIAAIRNVVTLHLSADCLEVFYFCCNSMPEFNNLVNLSFESHKERGWQVLPLLLKKSPNLETLVIKGLVHEITKGCGDACVCVHEEKKKKMKMKMKMKKRSCCLLSCQVKVLKIYGYGGSCREVKQMRHFMENLRCLELVKVEVQVDQQDKYVQVTNQLMNLLPPASSSKCKLHFI